MALVAGFLIGISGTAAFSVVAASDWRSLGPVGGLEQSNRAAIENPPQRGVATARSSAAVGPGRLGAYVHVVTSGGAICATASLQYSGSTTAAFSRYSTSGNCESGNHRAYGYSYHYRPSPGDYVSFVTYYSPYQG